MLDCNSYRKPRSLSERSGDPVLFGLRGLRANIKLTEFLTVENSLQLVEAKRRSRFSGAARSFNNF
jgi:hypothetical protein